MNHHAHELQLYIENDGELYRAHTQPAQRALALEKSGASVAKYTRANAVKRFLRVIEAGASKYRREFRDADMEPDELRFSAAEKKAVAEAFADHFETEYALGNYNHLLPNPAKGPAKRKTAAQLEREIRQVVGKR